MPLPVTLIFDVGKTNKKVLLFDKEYRLVFEQNQQLEETTDDEGFPCEDIHLLTQWVNDSFEQVRTDNRFKITAVNVSAYGASFVHLNNQLQPFLPLYNYLKPFPDELYTQFCEQYNADGKLANDTASPPLRNLNSGLQLYWLKHTKPDAFASIKVSLHLPQYISYLLGAPLCTELTSLGCHTALWHFSKNEYHNWVFSEKIVQKFPPIVPSTHVVASDDKAIKIGCGLHDSSAALIPYLATFTEPFVLLSTGTWCISLNPFDSTPLTAEDMQHDCLSYLSFSGTPVKASRLFAGYEHEKQVKRLSARFNKDDAFYKSILYNASISVELPNNIPSQEDDNMLNESFFSKRDLSGFKTFEEAYHQLMADIVFQQTIATKRVMKDGLVKKLFVDGGFGNNPVFMNLLANAFAEMEVYSANVPQASAIGAAIAVQGVLDNQSDSKS